MMNRRAFLQTVSMGVLAAPLATEAQPAGKVHRIGWLTLGTPTPPAPPFRDAFLQELRRLGYVEGQNLALDARYGDGRQERLVGLAAELVQLPVDVKVGDLGRVMLLAVDMDQAAEAFRYISELIGSVPELSAMVKSRSTKQGMLRLDLDNRIQILVKPADRRRVRGRTVLAVVASEISFWWDSETNANPATEVLRALRPSMLGIPGALLLAISSPYGRKGMARRPRRRIAWIRRGRYSGERRGRRDLTWIISVEIM